MTEQETPLPTLSPSRAADFKTCPLLYRFRTIDRIPEPPTADQERGTLVHAVLEKLFDLPSAERSHDRAAAMVVPQWERLQEDQPLLAELFGGEKKDMMEEVYIWLSEFAHPNFCSNKSAFHLDKQTNRMIFRHDADLQERDFGLASTQRAIAGKEAPISEVGGSKQTAAIAPRRIKPAVPAVAPA